MELQGGKVRSEVRLRRVDAKKWILGVKAGSGASRQETEMEVPNGVGEKLWRLTKGRRVVKRRYEIPLGVHTVEVDVYAGKVRGLVTAEVEFSSVKAMERFEKPAWLGREITGNKRYSNARLAEKGWTP